MNEQSFVDADYEVIDMVNRSRSNRGELPTVKLAFIPSDRADRVLALDQRIQTAQKFAPLITGAMILLSFLAGLLM